MMLRWIWLLPPAIDMIRPFRKLTAAACPALSSASQASAGRPRQLHAPRPRSGWMMPSPSLMNDAAVGSAAQSSAIDDAAW